MREGNINVLILRLEDLNRCFTKAIHEFLDLDGEVRLLKRNTNDGANNTAEYRYNGKQYSRLYLSVLNGIIISETTCNSMYAMKYARHFYTDNMIDQFVRTWSGSIPSEF